MPNRLIKESICTSGNLDLLTPEQEVLFYRLIVHCDDYGRTDARPAIIRGRCFPLKVDSITIQDVEQWLDALAAANIIILYSKGEGVYLQFITWENHQTIRAKKSKYPEYNNNCKQLLSIASISNQPKANDSLARARGIQSNPIQSNPNPIKGEVSNETVTEQGNDSDKVRGNGEVKKAKELADKLKTEQGEKVKTVFAAIDKKRGYRPPKRQAEAAAIIRMLKSYNPEQIIKAWEDIKTEPFWKDKELFLMTVESQIGAKLNAGNQSGPRKVKAPGQFSRPYED